MFAFLVCSQNNVNGRYADAVSFENGIKLAKLMRYEGRIENEE